MRQRTSDTNLVVADKRALLHVSRVLEEVVAREAGRFGAPVVTVSLFQDAGYFDHEVIRYAGLARLGPVVAGFAGVPAHHPPGVTLLPLSADEPLAAEWNVLVFSSHGAGALLAQDLGTAAGGTSIERGRLFGYSVTTDPALVGAAIGRVLDAAGDRLSASMTDTIRTAIDPATTPVAGPAARVLGRATEAALERTLHLSASAQRAEQLAATDPLTGAANRRALDRYLDRVGTRAPTIGVVALDLDDFKGINDTYGHSAGDLVLKQVAGAIRQQVRASDLLVRVGGDEFVLVCPGLDTTAVLARADAIVASVAALRLPAPAEQVRVRVSAGAGSFAPTAVDLAAVDAALYEAKRAPGRAVAVNAHSTQPVGS